MRRSEYEHDVEMELDDVNKKYFACDILTITRTAEAGLPSRLS